AVEDADLHELAVRAGAFGRESLTVPVLLRERAQRVEPGRGNGTELVEHLRARPVAIALDPPLVRLADVVADVRRVGTGIGRFARLLAREHALGADHVRDVVLHRPSRAV